MDNCFFRSGSGLRFRAKKSPNAIVDDLFGTGTGKRTGVVGDVQYLLL